MIRRYYLSLENGSCRMNTNLVHNPPQGHSVPFQPSHLLGQRHKVQFTAQTFGSSCQDLVIKLHRCYHIRCGLCTCLCVDCIYKSSHLCHGQTENLSVSERTVWKGKTHCLPMQVRAPDPNAKNSWLRSEAPLGSSHLSGTNRSASGNTPSSYR